MRRKFAVVLFGGGLVGIFVFKQIVEGLPQALTEPKTTARRKRKVK